jgi:hypothetical protein
MDEGEGGGGHRTERVMTNLAWLQVEAALCQLATYASWMHGAGGWYKRCVGSTNAPQVATATGRHFGNTFRGAPAS